MSYTNKPQNDLLQLGKGPGSSHGPCDLRATLPASAWQGTRKESEEHPDEVSHDLTSFKGPRGIVRRVEFALRLELNLSCYFQVVTLASCSASKLPRSQW